jgi:hypothetical protein
VAAMILIVASLAACWSKTGEPDPRGRRAKQRIKGYGKGLCHPVGIEQSNQQARKKGAQSLINLLAERKIKVHLNIQSDWYLYTAMLQTTQELVISSNIEVRLFPAGNGAKSIPMEEIIPNVTTKSYNLAFEKEFKDSALYKRFGEVSW